MHWLIRHALYTDREKHLIAQYIDDYRRDDEWLKDLDETDFVEAQLLYEQLIDDEKVPDQVRQQVKEAFETGRHGFEPGQIVDAEPDGAFAAGIRDSLQRPEEKSFREAFFTRVGLRRQSRAPARQRNLRASA